MALTTKTIRIASFPMTTPRHCTSIHPLLLTSLLMLVPVFAHAADNDIRLSTIGYLPDRSKVASVVGEAGSTFVLKRVSDDHAMLTADLSASISDADTNESIPYADFTSVVEPPRNWRVTFTDLEDEKEMIRRERKAAKGAQLEQDLGENSEPKANG